MKLFFIAGLWLIGSYLLLLLWSRHKRVEKEKHNDLFIG